ncbi:hypothetical protein F5877DRAFT_67349 [Lentinula edodes]|nr:hypothetical protein F5877DRAFT_67349 [Lentinula edodes]
MTEGVKGTGKAVLEKLGYLGDSAGRRSDVPVTLNHELPNSVKALGILPANYGTSMLNVKPVQPSAIVVLPFTYYDQALYFNRAFPRINDPNTPLPHFNEGVISGCVTYLSIYRLALARASWSKLDLFDLDPLRPEKTQKKIRPISSVRRRRKILCLLFNGNSAVTSNGNTKLSEQVAAVLRLRGVIHALSGVGVKNQLKLVFA